MGRSFKSLTVGMLRVHAETHRKHESRHNAALSLCAVVGLLAIALLIPMAVVAQTNDASRLAYAPYYIDELTAGNAIEKNGITYRSQHKDIDNAACIGLRRYGVHSDQYGLDKFHRFKCDADGANNHIYTVRISTTTGPKVGFWYTHYLSVSREF